MRVEAGAIVFLERHLARVRRSAGALGWAGVAAEADLREHLRHALADIDQGAHRLRLTASRGGEVTVAVGSMPPPRPPSAVSLIGAWDPRRRLAEHKTTSYAAYRRAQEVAESAGAGHALLLDRRGRLGETATANVVCALDGVLVTPPITGILPGVGRSVVLETLPILERHLEPEDWGRAQEMIALSALRGAQPIQRVDTRALSGGGSAADSIATALAEAATREAGLP